MSAYRSFESRATDIIKILEPHLAHLEKTRRGHLLFTIIVTLILSIVSIPIILLLFAGVYFAPSAESFYLFFLVAPAGLTILTMTYIAFDYDFRRKAKKLIVTEITTALNIKYKPLGNFKAGSIYDHYILPDYGRETSEDGLTFKYDGRQVDIQETKFHPPQNTDGAAAFFQNIMPERGLLICVETRKKQAFHTVLLPKRRLRGWVHKQRFLGMRHYHSVPFGIPAIDRNYTILSEKPSEAHFIFDPAFTERILSFEKLLGARNMSLSFKNNKFIIYARYAHNFFEPGHLLNPVTNKTIIKVMSEIIALEEILQALKLNPYVGL